LSFLAASGSSVVKIDVEAVGAMLDEMLAVPSRSPYEDLEPAPHIIKIGTRAEQMSRLPRR